MASITFLSNGITALNLWILTNKLKGDETQFRARERVRKKITTTWPELENQGLTKEEESFRQNVLNTDKRSIEINPTEQTALAEGLIKLLREMEISDAEKAQAFNFAKLCRFSNWLEKEIQKKEIREFAESDDGVELDPDEKDPA